MSQTHLLIRITALFLTLAVVGCYRKVEQEIVVHVPKMQSAACFRVIQEALRGLEQVKSATADYEQQTVTVRYDSEKLARRNIEYVIAGVGFAANDLPANPAAAKQLPEDCQ
jgi:copper chaperone CopZ